MRKLFILDFKNYANNLPEIRKISCRGIIVKDKKLLLVKTPYGEYKFPGGQRNKFENDFDTLSREILNQTGFSIVSSSVREFGEMEEKRKALHENMIWHQIHRFYFCDINEIEGDDIVVGEKETTYYWVTLDDAILNNQKVQKREGLNVRNQLELMILNELKKAKII